MNSKHISKAPFQQEPNPPDPPLNLNQKIQAMVFYRLAQILGDKNANPPIPPILPISRSSFYAGIKLGIYPTPIKIGAKVSAWRGEDILALLEKLGREVK